MPSDEIGSIELFSVAFHWVWSAVLFVTIASEVLPLRPLAPALLYSYVAWKVFLFVALGFLTPLAFWRFDSMGYGIVLSAVAAGSVELLQSLSVGHRSSYLEFGAKLLLISFGFILGLNTRYNGVLSVGTFRRYLLNPHQNFRD